MSSIFNFFKDLFTFMFQKLNNFPLFYMSAVMSACVYMLVQLIRKNVRR